MPFSHTRVVNTEPYVKGFICGEKYSRRRGEISSTRKIVGLQYGHHQNLPPPPPLSSPSPIIMLPQIILPPHRILTLYFSVGHCRLLGNNEYFFSLKYQVIRVWISLIELLGNLMKLNLGLIFFLEKKKFAGNERKNCNTRVSSPAGVWAFTISVLWFEFSLNFIYTGDFCK